MKMDSGLMNDRLFEEIRGRYLPDFIPEYADYFSKESAAIFPLLMQSKTVLDIGCGYGREFSFLEPFPSKIVAFDINRREIWEAWSNSQRYNNIDLAVADARQLPFADESFDLALLLWNVLGNAKDDKEKILSEAYRVLKPGSFVALSVYAENSAPYQLKQYMHWNIAQDYRVSDDRITLNFPFFSMETKRFSQDEILNLLGNARFAPGVRQLNEFTHFAVGRK